MTRMSTHIGAEPGRVAPYVLMPGDPLRARWIAETFLDDAECYSEVRGMYGFTGTYRGKRVSVQGSGMGLPSLSIYVNELFREYDVRTIVRVGSCGALTEDLKLRDLVIASGACTDSSMNRIRFEGLDYAPVADYALLRAAHDAFEARDLGIDAVYTEQVDGQPGFLVVDWKTNRSQTADPLQLAIYRLAWAELAGVPVERVRAAFYYVRTGDLVEPPGLESRDELEALLSAPTDPS
jgi:uridine phosphorylase